jgi:hypothetical protein
MDGRSSETGATRLSFVGRGVDLVAQGHSPLLRIRFAQGQRAGRHGDLADRFVRRALDLIAHLRESERLSAQNCAELREHLCGLRTAARRGLNEAAARPASARHGIGCPTPRGGSSTRSGPERVLSHRWSSEPFGPPGRSLRFS